MSYVLCCITITVIYINTKKSSVNASFYNQNKFTNNFVLQGKYLLICQLEFAKNELLYIVSL